MRPHGLFSDLRSHSETGCTNDGLQRSRRPSPGAYPLPFLSIYRLLLSPLEITVQWPRKTQYRRLAGLAEDGHNDEEINHVTPVIYLVFFPPTLHCSHPPNFQPLQLFVSLLPPFFVCKNGISSEFYKCISNIVASISVLTRRPSLFSS